jgi:dTDP-4-amino-4,6-dideoxygalactose transaminase
VVSSVSLAAKPGWDIFDGWLKDTRLGYNYRMDEMRAALDLAQITHIDGLLAKRAAVATRDDERLAGMELIQRPYIPTTTRMSWFVYVVRVRPRRTGTKRCRSWLKEVDQVCAALARVLSA